MKYFALVGVAGYIAKRHLAAIKYTGNSLRAALDPRDSVGILDEFFPDTQFFTEYERFDRYIYNQNSLSSNSGLDFLTICSPNYLHDSHVRFGLRSGMDVICEKPLVLNHWNLDGLKIIEEASGKKVNTILQLRLHPEVIKLRSDLQSNIRDTKHEVVLTYITSRGSWYLQSWKGDLKKSGGIATNIGIHFFDLLYYLFGKVQINNVHHLDDSRASGFLELERARVTWYLSLEAGDLPKEVIARGKRTFRSIRVDGEEVEMSNGFSDLHNLSYKKIMDGEGFDIEETRASISLVADIRNCKIKTRDKSEHPLLTQFVR